VGAEIQRPEKNMLRSLLLGLTAVTAIYLILNAVFLHVLGMEGLSKPGAVAARVVEPALGALGGKLISLMITISAIGAMSAQIFTGARIFYAMGREHRLYAIIGRWSERGGTPVWSLCLQAVATIAVIVVFGWQEGEQRGAFEKLVGFTAPLFFLFFTMVGLSVFVFRRYEPETPRPFRVPLFPLTPILFCLMTTFMLYAGLKYTIEHGDRWAFGWLVGGMAVGILMVFVNRALTPVEKSTN
jgi:amino acid transporter